MCGIQKYSGLLTKYPDKKGIMFSLFSEVNMSSTYGGTIMHCNAKVYSIIITIYLYIYLFVCSIPNDMTCCRRVASYAGNKWCMHRFSQKRSIL